MSYNVYKFGDKADEYYDYDLSNDVGKDGNAVVFTYAGDDQLFYVAGDDRYYAGKGDDHFIFDVDNGTMTENEDNLVIANGNRGNDTFDFAIFDLNDLTDADYYIVNGGKGKDTFNLSVFMQMPNYEVEVISEDHAIVSVGTIEIEFKNFEKFGPGFDFDF